MIDLAGAKVTVMGLGRFGGGIGVTRWLCQQGADVLVTDKDSAEDLADSIAKIQDLVGLGKATLRLGEHNVSDFTACDLVIANAAVPKPWENRFLRAAQAASIPVTTEIALAIDSLRARGVTRTIGITGSVGKSTTTAMIHHALCATIGTSGVGTEQAHTTVFLGGNIGGSLLTQLADIGPRAIVVLELSSAMLHWLHEGLTPRWAPHVAVATNISANHLDWHGDFDHYAASKQHILRHQSADDIAVLGPTVWSWRDKTLASATQVFAEQFTGKLALPGEHNRENAAAALLACAAIAPEADLPALAAAIRGYSGLAHRLQRVAEWSPVAGERPVRFFNDSKSTTPESALKGVQAIAAMPGCGMSKCHLIAGGYDKGSDLSPIARLAGELGGLYTIGATGPAIAAAARSLGADGSSRVHECATLASAVQAALPRLAPGDVLLLSPGCASWDQYVNFEARGDEFVALVHALIKERR